MAAKRHFKDTVAHQGAKAHTLGTAGLEYRFLKDLLMH